MHALATAKAGSLGDERYIQICIAIDKCSTYFRAPKMAVFHAFVQRQSVCGNGSCAPTTRTRPLGLAPAQI